MLVVNRAGLRFSPDHKMAKHLYKCVQEGLPVVNHSSGATFCKPNNYGEYAVKIFNANGTPTWEYSQTLRGFEVARTDLVFPELLQYGKVYLNCSNVAYLEKTDEVDALLGWKKAVELIARIASGFLPPP